MDTIEQTAKTVEEATNLALKKLGAGRDDVDVEVLSEGRAGIFGIGAEDARVRVTRRPGAVPPPKPAPARPEQAAVEVTAPAEVDHQAVEIAAEVLDRMLALMQVEATVEVRPATAEAPAALNVMGDDLGILIGRRGDTLAALQFLVNLIVSKRVGQPTRVTVDVENYRLRRAASLTALALRVAERVAESRRSMALEEMPPAERRIVHLALADHPQVTTQSVGEGDHRKVVIVPK